ncbi:MAG: hypothetical protein LH606_18235 [Cytophagaceae bacterium]|nr:hypothetical protein [Cytophagaceae bacterium]
MLNLLIIIFTMTLTYLAVAGRLDTYIRVIVVQGVLLFGIAFLELAEIDPFNLLFILLETLIFKSILVPYFTSRAIKRNGLKHEIEPGVSNFYSVFIVIGFVIGSFVVAYQLHDTQLKVTYFTASISSLLTGLFLIVSRKSIVTHLIGYMVIENGIFLLSLALGSELPMIVNYGILLDLFTSVLILITFVNRIGDVFKSSHITSLTELKD